MWLGPIFEIFGGGGSVFQMILRTIIAEAVPAASLQVDSRIVETFEIAVIDLKIGPQSFTGYLVLAY
jgi:hypothetical protein